MAAVFQVSVVGFDDLKKAVSQLEATTASQVKLQQECVALTRSMKTLVSDGFNQLNSSMKALQATQKASEATTQKQITSAQQLSKAWLASLTPIRELNAQMLKQQSASGAALANLRALTLSTNQYAMAAREALLADRANVAAANQLSASYGKISAVMAERMNLENGTTAAVNKRLASEQALLAIERQRHAASALASRDDQARAIAASNLTNAQKLRTMAELGLIDLVDRNERATSRSTNTVRNFAGAQRELHSALRGVGAAMDGLFLTYGSILPMLTAFLATMTGIKSLKLGMEFEAQALYIHELQDAGAGLVLTLDEIERKLLGIHGVGKSPMELAAAVKELVKAGIDASSAIESVGYMAKFATVVETDMAKAAELVTSQWKAWGESLPEEERLTRGVTSMNELMDILAATTVKTKVGMEDLKIAVNYLTPLSSTTRATYIDMMALAGALGDIGLQGSTGTQAVRTGLMRLGADADKVAQRFKEVGVAFNPYTDASRTKLKQGVEMLNEFFGSVSKVTSESKAAEIMMKSLGLRALQLSGLKLDGAADGVDKIGKAAKGVYTNVERLRDELQKVQEMSRMKEGFVGTIFEKLSDSALFKLTEIKARISGELAAAFDSDKVKAAFDRLLNVIDSGAFSKLIGTLAGFTAGVLEVFSKIASGGVGAINELLGPFAKVVALFYAARAATVLWNAALALNPVFAGVALAGAGVIALDNYLGKVKEINENLILQNKINNPGLRSTIGDPMVASPMYPTGTRDSLHSYSGLAASASSEFSAAVAAENKATADGINLLMASADKAVEQSAKTAGVAVSGTSSEVKVAMEEAAQAVEGLEGGLSSMGAAVDKINIGALKADIDRFAGKDSSAFSQFSSQLGNEVDGYIEKAKKLAAQNKTSIDSVWASLGTSEAQLRQFQKTKEEAFKADQAKELDKNIRDLGVSMDSFTKRAQVGDKYAEGLRKISEEGAKLKNEMADLAEKMVLEKQAGSLSEAMAKIAKETGYTVDELKDLEKAAEKALQTEIIDEYTKSAQELTDQLGFVSREQELLNENTRKYDGAQKLLQESKGAIVAKQGLAAYNAEWQRLAQEEKAAIANNVDYLKSTNNMWNGFKAGAIEAQKDLRTLGDLGYEIFQDLKEGLAGVWKSVLTGDFDSVGSGFKAIGDSLLDTVTSHFSEVLATKTLSIGSKIFGGLFSSLGLGDIFGGSGPSYTGGAMNVFVTNGDGLLGGEAGGGIIESIKSGVSEVFGPTIAGWLGKIGSAVGVAGGAYGLYSGYKAMKEGNTGSGALQMGLGAVSAYKGAVGLGMINPGTATAMMKSLATSVGFQTAASETAVTAISSQAGQRAAVMAAQKALSGTATTAATAYTPGAGATSYGTFQSAASGGGGMSAGIAAGATYATVAAAAAMVVKGIIDKSNRPDAANEIDKAGVTPGSLGAIHNQWKALNQTVLASIPGFQNYTSAIYSTNTSMLVASGAAGSMALRYDETAAAGNRWKTFLTSAPPALQAAAERTAAWNLAITGNNNEVGRSAELAMIGKNNLAAMNAMLSTTAGETVELRSALSGTASASESAANATSSLTGVLSGEASASSKAAGSTRVLVGSLGALTPPLSQVKAAASGAAPSIYSLINSIQGFGASISSVAGSISSAANAVGSAASRTASAYQQITQTSYRRNGGRIGYATGGVLQGGSYEKDDLYLGTVNGVAQVAMGGEYIMPKAQTAKYLPDLERMRRQEYATGGKISVADATAKKLAAAAAAKAAAEAAAKASSSSSSSSSGSDLGSIMDDIRKQLAEFDMTDYEKSINQVMTSYEATRKQLLEAGSSKADRQLLDKLRNKQLDEVKLAPIKEAVTALGDFRKQLEGVEGATKSSAAAQEKLFGLLEKARGGDYSGLTDISDFLSDISIDKANYATALDYARDYWKTMAAVGELEKLAGVHAKVPGFAVGGYHVGGLRVVGENGPELEYTGASRIYNRDQLIDLTAVLEELAALRQAVNNGNVAVATNTKKTADSLRRYEVEGLLTRTS